MTSTDCIFCKIVKGDIPCAQVFSSPSVLAFLDIQPVSPGHVLVIPREHHATLLDLPPSLGADLVEALGLVSKALMDETGATGFNLQMNNFASAGQLVHHAHFHLIPRFDDDGLKLWPQKSYPDNEAMISLAKSMAGRIKS